MALQMLYALDLNPAEEHPSIPGETEGARVPFDSLEFAEEIIRGVKEHRAEIDRLISEKSEHWSISRMARVDLGILRMAIFELLFRADIPRNVTINEAIEVAKKFGSEDSPAFINGILDEVAAGLQAKE
jgi:N utilization substance protein B